MLIKVSEATNRQIDWLVAKCVNPDHGMVRSHQDNRGNWHVTLHGECGNYAPSTDWSQGGPIIERELFQVYPSGSMGWCTTHADGVKQSFGPTPLIAAMRCYCCSKLGDEVDVPEELCQ